MQAIGLKAHPTLPKGGLRFDEQSEDEKSGLFETEENIRKHLDSYYNNRIWYRHSETIFPPSGGRGCFIYILISHPNLLSTRTFNLLIANLKAEPTVKDTRYHSSLTVPGRLNDFNAIFEDIERKAPCPQRGDRETHHLSISPSGMSKSHTPLGGGGLLYYFINGLAMKAS